MTYYKSESAVAGANQQKLIIEAWTTPDVNAINWDTNNVSILVKASTFQTLFSGDNQTLNRTGNWSGSTNYYMPASANATVNIFEQTFNVTPQTSGTVTVNYGGNITGHYGGASFSANVQIVIAQKPFGTSQVSLSSTNFNMGTTVTVNTNRLNTAFTHTIGFKFGGYQGWLHDVGASTTFDFPIADFAPQIPNATSGTGTVICETYNGSTLIGTSTTTFTAKVPSSVVPVLGTVSVSDTNTTVNTVLGTTVYAQYLSRLAVSLTGCSAPHGATIVSQTIKIGNDSAVGVTPAGTSRATSKTYTMPQAITTSGTLSVVGTVTDSRGRVVTKTANISIMAYTLPSATKLSVIRTNSAGTADPLGTYIKATMNGSVKSLSVASTERNRLSYQLQRRQLPSGTFTDVIAKTAESATLTLNTTSAALGTFIITAGFEFKLIVYDKFNNSSTMFTIGTGEVTLSLNKSGIGVGKVWSKGSIDAAGAVYAAGGFYPAVDIIPASTNLNTYTTAGVYVQNIDADAASGSNYPEPIAGYLEVITQNTVTPTTSWTLQRYTVYNTERVYTRRLYNNAWSPWTIQSSPPGTWNTVTMNAGYTSSGVTAVKWCITANILYLRGTVTHANWSVGTHSIGTIAPQPPVQSPIYIAYFAIGAGTITGLVRTTGVIDLIVMDYQMGNTDMHINATIPMHP